jgi:DNA mismatch repair protein MutL
LYVTIQPDLVDVNIHPRKEEIAFWDDAFVYETLVKFFKTFLATQDLTYIKNTGDETKDAYDFKELKKASKFPFMTLKDSVDTWSLKNLADSNDSSQILQIANTYLAVPIKDGLLLIDQHAAHESILYEDYLKAFQAKVLSQSPVELDEPVIVNLSIVDAAVLVDCMKDLELLGFSIHPFGQNSFRISAVPELFKTHNLAKLLQELLAEMTASHNGKLTDIDEKSQKTLAFLACRGAIKAGEKLSPDEKMHLVEKLANSKELYTCPHGRPVKIILTNRELAHMFKRV